MTLENDGPPLTRRQLRERERAAETASSGEATDTSGDDAASTGAESDAREQSIAPEPPAPATFAHLERREPEPSTASEPAIDPHAVSDSSASPDSPRATSPRASNSYGGRTRPHLPSYTAPFDAVIGATPTSDDGAMTAVLPADDVPLPLPEAAQPGGAANASTTMDAADASTPAAPAGFVSPFAPREEEPPLGASEGASATATGALVSSAYDNSGIPERTLTRRELRALMQAQEAAAPVGAAELLSGRSSDGGAEASHAPEDVAAAVDFGAASQPEKTGDVAAPSVEVRAVTPSDSPVTPSADPAGLTVDPETASGSPDAPAETDKREVPTTTGSVAHWANVAEHGDEQERYDQVLSRSVGSAPSATTTNALILPAIPSVPDATGPLTATGEILVTGSIDLPRSLGATGQHPDRYDSADLDRMFDQAESELGGADVAPIRASRAVSSTGSTRGMIAPPKRRGGRFTIVLGIVAGVLALAVLGLLVVSYLTKIL